MAAQEEPACQLATLRTDIPGVAAIARHRTGDQGSADRRLAPARHGEWHRCGTASAGDGGLACSATELQQLRSTQARAAAHKLCRAQFQAPAADAISRLRDPSVDRYTVFSRRIAQAVIDERAAARSRGGRAGSEQRCDEKVVKHSVSSMVGQQASPAICVAWLTDFDQGLAKEMVVGGCSLRLSHCHAGNASAACTGISSGHRA
jgi:hypothetical protein